MGQANGKEKGESGSQSFDGGSFTPQGVYSSAQDYDHTVVRTNIQNRKLAPFYPGLDDEEAYAQAPFNTECPICFLVSIVAFTPRMHHDLLTQDYISFPIFLALSFAAQQDSMLLSTDLYRMLCTDQKSGSKPYQPSFK
jgi:hypothetical protein